MEQCFLLKAPFLNPSPNKSWFLHVCSTSVLKTMWEKGEIAHNEQFLLFPQCFLPFWITLRRFHPIQNWNLFQIGSQKFVIWERVNPLPDDKF